MKATLIRPTYWEADECEYVDVWYDTLIRTMLKLKLIKHDPLWWNHKTSIEIFDRLWLYKE